MEPKIIRGCAHLLGLLCLHDPDVWLKRTVEDVWEAVKIRAAQLDRPADLMAIDMMTGNLIGKLGDSYVPFDRY